MAHVFDAAPVTTIRSGYSSHSETAETCRRPSYRKRSYVSSNMRHALRAAHHSARLSSSSGSTTAPVGLLGELTMMPRVRSLARSTRSDALGF
jgi:hypothetical protein